ncbi:50S ribosomal protein L21e [Candidatus Woesearchaeota archaeon]|nr:50S ribosomal protein L21e [Candidatus Woesearchaeota archaeon]|tara:strand:- start:14363 stop:14674 length:312 start_codon:yes stop_codon:yes gene_type:complete
MTKNTGTARTKTRNILKVPKKLKGKLNIGKFFQKLKEGDRVVFKASPSIQKGMYHQRFHGKSGQIVRIRGKSYEVNVKDKNKLKKVIVNPVHLAKVKNGTKNN